MMILSEDMARELCCPIEVGRDKCVADGCMAWDDTDMAVRALRGEGFCALIYKESE